MVYYQISRTNVTERNESQSIWRLLKFEVLTYIHGIKPFFPNYFTTCFNMLVTFIGTTHGIKPNKIFINLESEPWQTIFGKLYDPPTVFAFFEPNKTLSAVRTRNEIIFLCAKLDVMNT